MDSGSHQVSAQITLAEVLDKYRALREDSGRPVRDDTNTHYMLNHLSEGLGACRVSALDTDKLLAWCQQRRRAGAGPYTLNMEIGTLGTALRPACYGCACRISSARRARCCITWG
jgi:hypothetical protein